MIEMIVVLLLVVLIILTAAVIWQTMRREKSVREEWKLSSMKGLSIFQKDCARPWIQPARK